MTAKQLIAKLSKVEPETEVYFENRGNPCGNINDIYFVKKEEVYFFGKPSICLIIRGHK